MTPETLPLSFVGISHFWSSLPEVLRSAKPIGKLPAVFPYSDSTTSRKIDKVKFGRNDQREWNLVNSVMCCADPCQEKLTANKKVTRLTGGVRYNFRGQR